MPLQLPWCPRKSPLVCYYLTCTCLGAQSLQTTQGSLDGFSRGKKWAPFEIEQDGHQRVNYIKNCVFLVELLLQIGGTLGESNVVEVMNVLLSASIL